MEFFPEMKLIHLIRNPLEVARSELNRHQWLDNIHFPFRYYTAENGEKYFRWALTGMEDIFQDVKIDSLTPFQQYVVQWIEIENRAMNFLDKYNKHDCCYTLSVDKDLNNPGVLAQLFHFFGLERKTSQIIMRGRRNRNIIPAHVTNEDKRQFREVINHLPSSYLEIFQKKPYTNFEWVKYLTK